MFTAPFWGGKNWSPWMVVMKERDMAAITQLVLITVKLIKY